ncbi:hypothetical protein GOV07_05105, partial [Candidatus Woesearchaeota archaeon]|nr:hypothetical protein [Candidatus Woesearchaeota archaeon]
VFNGTFLYANTTLSWSNYTYVIVYDDGKAIIDNVNANYSVSLREYANTTITNSDIGWVSVLMTGIDPILFISGTELKGLYFYYSTNPTFQPYIENINVTSQLTVDGRFTFHLRGSNNISAVDISIVPTWGDAIMSGNVTFSESEADTFGTDDITRVYPLTVTNDTGGAMASENVTILSNISDNTTIVWTGLTDANGRVDFNVTFNSTNYNDTFYIWLPDQTNENQSFKLLTDTPLTYQADNCDPPANGDWLINSTDNVICSNAGNITITGSVIIEDTASLTITSGTTIDATSFNVTNTSTFTVSDNADYYGTINLLHQATLNMQNLNLSALGAYRYLNLGGNQSTGVNITITNASLSNTIIWDVYNYDFLNITDSELIAIALLYVTNGEQATITNSNFSSGLSIVGLNASLNASNMYMDSVTTTTIDGTGNAQITLTNVIMSNTIGLLVTHDGNLIVDNSNVEGVVSADGTVVLTNSNVTGSVWFGTTFSDGNFTTSSATIANCTIEDGYLFDGGTADVTNTTFNYLYLFGNRTINFISNNNVVSTLELNSNSNFDTIYHSNSYVGGTYSSSRILTGNNIATLTGNVSIQSTGTVDVNQSLVRVYPVTLTNESSGSVGSGLNVTLKTSPTGPTHLWTDFTDANGRVQPNITFTSANYATTYYLTLHDYFDQYTPISLLTDTSLNWTDIQSEGPFIVNDVTGDTLYSGAFGFDADFSNDTTDISFEISNGTDTWANATWNFTQLNASNWNLDYDYNALYLPVGNWTLNITATNSTGATTTINATWDSKPMMITAMVGSAYGEANIGGSDVTFGFDVTVKSGAGSKVAAFLDLDNLGSPFNIAFARLTGNSQNASVSEVTSYAGAGNITLGAASGIPSYVEMDISNDLKSSRLILTITPYPQLIPGTYTGSYGFGVIG